MITKTKSRLISRSGLLMVTAVLLFVQTACGRTSATTRSADQSQAIQPAAAATPEAVQPEGAGQPDTLPTSTPPLQATVSGDQFPTSLEGGEDILNQAVRTTQGIYPRIAIADMQTAGQSESTKMRIENAAPGTGRLTVEQGGVMLMEVIMITPTLYVNQAGSGWTTLPADQAAAYGSVFTEVIDMKTFRGDVDAGVQMTIQYAGQEVLNGVDTDIYTLEAQLSDGSTSSGKIWISAQDKRILMYMLQTSTGITLQQRYEYDISVQVEAPISGVVPQIRSLSCLPS